MGAASLRLAMIKLNEAAVMIAHLQQPIPPSETAKDQVALPSPNGGNSRRRVGQNH